MPGILFNIRKLLSDILIGAFLFGKIVLYQIWLHRNDILKEPQECNEDKSCLNASRCEPHQTNSELSKLDRQASDPIERTRYQIIWLLATGRVTEDVADVTGYCRNSIYRLVRRYNQLGAHGLKDKRHQHPGAQPLLSVVQQAQLLQSLRTPTADGGLWNSRQVAELSLV